MTKRALIFSIAYYPHVGGAEIAVKEITDRVSDIEWHMVTCALSPNLPQQEKIGMVHVHRVSCPKYLFPFVAWRYARKLHTHTPFDFTWSIMAAYAGFANLFFKITHVNVPFLLTLQEGDPIEYIKRKVWFIYPLFRLIFKRADKVQAISKFLASFGRDMGHDKPIEVIANGVDVPLFSQHISDEVKNVLRVRMSKQENDVYLVTTSRLVRKNAVDDIISALAILPSFLSLVIIGQGEEGQRLSEQAEQLGVIDRVKFVGFIPHEDIPIYFSICDIFVRPSRSEGFGNSFIEAMAAGLPVVATPVGGIVDFIDDQETGVFCCPDNPKSLAEAIMSLVDNHQLVKKIVAGGYERVVSEYSWDHIAQKMRDQVFNTL
ncbi:MAG: hypothetical protein QG579_107 [Patescibacteria group bacterium]|nr:hypothetical protein [Patescibacteria group bacterium]MDQ5968950.1 hypothetical protein [Patescibacteria group bacterium]